MFKLFALSAPALLVAGMSFAASSVMEKSAGGVLVDPAGMTVYTYDKDKDGISSCYGGCAAAWPPVLASTDAEAKGAFTLVQRRDGSAQWSYNGMPLYTWAGDTKPGDMSGDGVGGVWHVVK